MSSDDADTTAASILDAQGAQKWDVMLLWVFLGSALILAGDIVSALARGLIRRAR